MHLRRTPNRRQSRAPVRTAQPAAPRGPCAAARPALFCFSFRNPREDHQWPGQPRPSLKSASASRSTGTCRPSSDLGPFAWVRRGRLTALMLGWGRCSLELSLPDMQLGICGEAGAGARKHLTITDPSCGALIAPLPNQLWEDMLWQRCQFIRQWTTA